jgi:hypothetical protein
MEASGFAHFSGGDSRAQLLLNRTYPHRLHGSINGRQGYLFLYRVLSADSFNQNKTKWYKRLITKPKITAK